MASTGTLRRTPLALATALLVVAGTLALGLTSASASFGAVRKYSATVTPNDCVVAGSVTRFTATITNSTTSNQQLGSALFHSNNVNGFKNIYSSSFTTPVATGGKTWVAIPDTIDADGVYLKASSSSQALSPGQSVSMTFEAKAPSSTGNKAWVTNAWQGNNFLTGSFSFAPGQSNPVVNVQTSCAGPAANISFVTGPSDTSAGGTMAAVKVKVTDTSNNPVSGQSVTVASAGLAVSPSAPQTTGGDGVATFSGLVVGTTAGSFGMTATSGSLTTAPASYSITAGSAMSISFTRQPTNTLLNTPINDPDGVEVTAKDSHGNPVSGLAISLSISPNSFAMGTLTGGGPVITGADGTATFPNVKVQPTSSGYELRTSVGNVDSDPFAITNTDPTCTSNCTAMFPNGSTVSAPDGTTLIIENNDIVTCDGAVSNPVAGTVTIIPDPNGPNLLEVTFFDPYDNIKPVVVGKSYPVCKGGPGHPDGQILGPCSGPSDAPCVKSQTLAVGSLDMTTIVRMTPIDPPIKH
jgi:hypothetical protein